MTVDASEITLVRSVLTDLCARRGKAADLLAIWVACSEAAGGVEFSIGKVTVALMRLERTGYLVTHYQRTDVGTYRTWAPLTEEALLP